MKHRHAASCILFISSCSLAVAGCFAARGGIVNADGGTDAATEASPSPDGVMPPDVLVEAAGPETAQPGADAQTGVDVAREGPAPDIAVGPGQVQLTLTKRGSGGGRVVSDPPGIDCRQTCTALFTAGTAVKLTATVDPASTFGGWAGACTSATTTCQFRLDSSQSAQVIFHGGGETIWARPTGAGRDLALTTNGDVVVTGTFPFATDFGAGAVSSASYPDAFIARYGPNGEHRWSKQVGPGNWEEANDVLVDGSDNITVIVGSSATLDFGGGPLMGGDSNSMFLVQYSGTGQHRWSKVLPVRSWQWGWAMVHSVGGQLTLAGTFEGDVTLEDAKLQGSPNRQSSAFLADYGADGAQRSVRVLAKTGTTVLSDLVRDATGALYLVGRFAGTTDVGGGPVASAGGTDIFVTKLTSMGDHLWSKTFGGPADDDAMAATLDPGGALIVTGKFAGTAQFGSGLTLTSLGRQDTFVAKLDAGGRSLWTRGFGGMDSATDSREGGYAVAVDRDGAIYVAGASAGSTRIGDVMLPNRGGDDALVIRLSPTGDAVWARAYGSQNSVDIATALAFGPDGMILVSGYAPGGVDFGTGSTMSIATGYLLKLAP